MAGSTMGTASEPAQTALFTLLEGPAMSPPAGVLPNFHNPPSLDLYLTLTIALCVAFGTLAVLLRMYTKVFIVRVLAWEDYIIALAWLLQVGYTIPSGIVTQFGGGRHMWDVQLHSFFKMLYWVNISAIVYGFVIFFIKLSILLQYLRIFAPSRKGNMFIYLGVHLCIWSNLIVYFVETVMAIAKCTPRKKFWTPMMTTGHCINVDAPFQATGVFNVISDFAILILPMPCVWRLHMPLKTKILMTTIFAAGFFACITSILRTYYSWKIAQSPDVSYNMVPMGMWASAELSTGIVISCLPVIPRFFQHFSPKISSALTLHLKSSKRSGSGSAPTSAVIKPSSDVKQAEKLKLPSLNHTFASVVASHAEGKDVGRELYEQLPVPKREYLLLGQEKSMPGHNATGEPSQMPRAKLATTRDDLERGYGRF